MSINTVTDGSTKTLWKISSSLMISFLSILTMLFVDRIFLDYYSTDAFTAATSAGTLCWGLSLTWVTLAAMAEIFVAQYNGTKKYHKLGEPVWQMIYLSGLSFIFFFLIAKFGNPYLHQVEHLNIYKAEFFRWNNYFTPFLVLFTAISSFYIGQGKTHVIKWLGIGGNALNIILDPLFIFGYKNWIPSMGIKGAAIATGIGIIFQLVIISLMFFSKKNREVFGTNQYLFKLKPFLKCLKVGIPPAIFVFFELIGWWLFYVMMEEISPIHIVVASVMQSIVILFLFFGLGLEKGVAAVSGNLIGAKKFDEIPRLFKSGVLLCFAFMGFLFICFIGFPDLLIMLFFKGSNHMSPSDVINAKQIIRWGLATLVIYMTLENIRFLIGGILLSAGDTLFLMIGGSLSVWLFLTAPIYYFVMLPKAKIEVTFYIWIAYAFLSGSIYFIRFLQGKWRKSYLIENTG